MARKVRGFERVLDAPALFAVAYGEIASSIYVALGIVAAYALGLTPVVLAVTGLIFGLVALSYAEGTAAIPETGGAETFTRRAPRLRISSNAQMSASYSATWLVLVPMARPIFSTTAPDGSHRTTPKAAGPGLPREPPSHQAVQREASFCTVIARERRGPVRRAG